MSRIDSILIFADLRSRILDLGSLLGRFAQQSDDREDLLSGTRRIVHLVSQMTSNYYSLLVEKTAWSSIDRSCNIMHFALGNNAILFANERQ